MESLFERSKMESRYAEPTKHKAQEFVEKFPKCASAADPEFFRTKAVQAKEWLESVQKFLGWLVRVRLYGKAVQPHCYSRRP